MRRRRWWCRPIRRRPKPRSRRIGAHGTSGGEIFNDYVESSSRRRRRRRRQRSYAAKLREGGCPEKTTSRNSGFVSLGTIISLAPSTPFPTRTSQPPHPLVNLLAVPWRLPLRASRERRERCQLSKSFFRSPSMGFSLVHHDESVVVAVAVFVAIVRGTTDPLTDRNVAAASWPFGRNIRRCLRWQLEPSVEDHLSTVGRGGPLDVLGSVAYLRGLAARGSFPFQPSYPRDGSNDGSDDDDDVLSEA